MIMSFGNKVAKEDHKRREKEKERLNKEGEREV